LLFLYFFLLFCRLDKVYLLEGRKSLKNLNNFKVIEANIGDEDSVGQEYPDQEFFTTEQGPTFGEIYDKF
jgi:hypothetical protein